MPRAKKEEASAGPRKRSRTGCWPCKARKVKCSEERPTCANCAKTGDTCDYSIRLNWGGRSKRDYSGAPADPDNGFTFVATPASMATAKAGHEHVFSSQHIATARPMSGHATSPAPSTQSTSVPQISEPTQLHPPPLDAPYLSQNFAGPPPTSVPVDWSPKGTSKRLRMSPRSSTVQAGGMLQSQAEKYNSPGSAFYSPLSMDSVANTPATPGSSMTSTPPYAFGLSDSHHISTESHAPDLRRLSVKSLLSDPTDEQHERPRYPRVDSHGCRTYGFDTGQPDYDIPHNDDRAAIQLRSPELPRRLSAAVSEVSTSSLEPEQRDIAFEPGGYYAKPVAIRIPRTLEPLPQELRENSMNLLYFHHFINHTARILVPHDCPDNPLRGVLPQMAIRNTQLLHLLLAFSAAHRARLLGHAEPATRIAAWMDDVLPTLRGALSEANPEPVNPDDLASLAPLATAIMLATLEIISPNSFAIPISWQNHLDVARSLLVSKGGLHRLSLHADGMRDKAVFLISRWFAYLDVLGSLSGGKHRRPLAGAYDEDGGGSWLVNRTTDELFKIDCFFGFSGRCIALLAAVAGLAATQDRQRIDPITKRQRPDWQPSGEVRRQALELRQSLQESARHVNVGCMHSSDTQAPDGVGGKSDQERDEILATNEAYHWAGMLHLSRRVLGLARESVEVQDEVRRVLDSLRRMRQGSTAESCLLFPMFAAGCECIQPDDQQIFLRRMRAVEGWGMQHVARARDLMQTVWQTGDPWEVLVDGEFFG